MATAEIYGWDIGGAHVKACRSVGGRLLDVAQWACPLWQGQQQLDAVLAGAAQRWPALRQATHAVTMTGELVDLFAHREQGVQRIAAQLAQALAPGEVHFFAGDAGWCGAAQAAAQWQDIASANWLATARHVALCRPRGACVLVDIGSTTTDLIALRDGQVLTSGRSDAERLSSGELVYQGVVRTPLCALAPRIAWRDRSLNVMNEFFATAADVYRLTGELDPAHDQHPAADNAGKDLPATRRRLARMIGLDARDGSTQDWLDFARAWRTCQVQEIAAQLRRVLDQHRLGADTALVGAGCGDFLVPELATRLGLDRCLAYAGQVAQPALPDAAALARWVQVCAPSVAVAALLERELVRCGS